MMIAQPMLLVTCGWITYVQYNQPLSSGMIPANLLDSTYTHSLFV